MKFILNSSFILVLGVIIIIGTNAQNACRNPNGQIGSCIPIKSCSSLVNILRKKLTNDERNFLKQSQCGYDGRTPLVCCVENGFNVGNSNVQKPVSQPQSVIAPGDRSGLIPEIGECGVQIGNRIFGGRTTKLDEYPWIAILDYLKPDDTRGFHCGGTLINDKYVVTAAHCIPSASGNPSFRLLNVRLGEYDLNRNIDCNPLEQTDCADPPQDIPVEQIFVHEGYDMTTNHHDIALIRLARPVRQTYFVKPICLPMDPSLRSANAYVGEKFDVAGWGKTEWGYKSSVKLKVEVRGTTNDECKAIYERSASPKEIISQQVCAGGERGKDSCNGDSGGPLMGFHQDDYGNAYWYLAGIVSFGPSECGLPGWPGVYTRVSSYLNWIENRLRP